MGLARTNRLLPWLVTLCASAVGCQGSTSLSFAGALVFAVTGTGITGTVPGPCEVDVDFGVVPIGLASTATIQIQSQATRTVTFGAFTQPDPELSVSPDALRPLAAGIYTQLSVRFSPARSGELSSSFSIPTDLPSSVCGSSSSSILVKLAGQGVQLSLSVAPTTLDFGTVLRGESAVETVTLTNTSSVAVSGITAVTGTDASQFTAGSRPGCASRWRLSVAVQVTYAPTALEKQSDATVTFSGSAGESATLKVSGTPVGVALSSARLDFGYVPPGTTAIACTSVSNVADVAVTIELDHELRDRGVFVGCRWQQPSQINGATDRGPAAR